MNRPARPRTADQRGVTLIEVLVVVAVAAIIGVPVTSWVISTLGHQDASQHLLRNAVGTGTLASNLSRDISSASQVLADGVASDCDGGGEGAGGDLVLSVVPSHSANRVVYTQAATANSAAGHQSLWRRVCDDTGAIASATEVFERIIPGSVNVSCVASNDGPGGDCGDAVNKRVRLRLTPCPTRPAQAANTCNPTGASQPTDVELHATRRVTPGFEDYAGSSAIAQIRVNPRVGYVDTDFGFDSAGSRGVNPTWEFPGGDTRAGATVTHRFPTAGTYEVRLRMSGADGSTNVAVVTVQVINRHPVATVTAVPGATPDQWTFDGSGSSAHGAAEYRWSFSGGGEITGPSVVQSPFAAGAEGRRRVTLRVTDANGNSDTATVVVDFGTRPSGPITIDPDPIDTPGRVALVGSVGPDLPDLTVSFRTDDGVEGRSWRLTRAGTPGPVATSDDMTLRHVFRDGDAGVYQIERLGPDGEPVTDPVAFRVNAAPRADFTVTVGAAGTPTRFVGNATGGSTDPDGTIASWRWDFGSPGATATGPTPTHTYAGPGSYVVTLIVTDDDGAESRVVRAVQIPGTPAAPAPPRWTSNDTVVWDAVPRAEEYRVEFWCGAGAPAQVDVPATQTTANAPADFCPAAATAALRVRIGTQWSFPSEQAGR